MYASGTKPKLLEQERQLGVAPIRAEMWYGQTLTAESRVNYSKVSTVEHNFKVFIMGRIVDTDLRTFRNAVENW